MKLMQHPQICPGSYELHLYCKYDNPAHGYTEFPHIPSNCQTRGEAVAVARKMGWIVHRDGLATCPKCVKALK